jgi:hypothetical protein
MSVTPRIAFAGLSRAPYTGASLRSTDGRLSAFRFADWGMTDTLSAFVRTRPLAVLLFICVIAWLPVFSRCRRWIRDESRFAQATKQMLETRDFVDINLGAGRDTKSRSGSIGCRRHRPRFSAAAFATRFGRIACPLCSARSLPSPHVLAGAPHSPERAAFYAGLILGLSVLLMSEAKIAKTDAALLGALRSSQAGHPAHLS